jgi:nucleotide-binding universal stress UspA family protein
VYGLKQFGTVTFSSKDPYVEDRMHTVAAGTRVRLKNILFATDLSECANKALPYALSVARRYGAMIHAAYVWPGDSPVFDMSADLAAMVAEGDERRMREYVAMLEKQVEDVPHRVTTPKGNIWDALAKIIKEEEIDMLVVGTHGRTGVRKLFMGSVAENLLRRAECPVMSIGPSVLGKGEQDGKFRRILFPTDFSEESLTALPYAVSLAEEDEAPLLLLHVVDQPAAGMVNLEADTEFLRRRLRDLISPATEPWCRTECLVEFGEQFALPTERILKVAHHTAADLIVLGVRPVHGNLGLVTHLSSTTARILTQAACPVLTVRG